MTAVRAGDVEALIRRGPDSRIPLLLVYGPDAGLATERARALAESYVADPADPFALVRIDGDALASDPGRLCDEAGTVGLFGGRRAIWVRPTGRNIAPAVEALLAIEVADARVVVEGGDLAKANPLRTLCERSPRALALPCFPDDERALADLVDRTLRERGLRIEREAREVLVRSLGGDRRASLMEIDKLALYAAGAGTVTLDHVEAVVSDVAASVLNTLIDAAFDGRREAVERDVRRFRLEGLDPGVVLGAALRHALALLAARLDNPDKTPAATAAAWRGLHFKRRDSVTGQLGTWGPATLRQAIPALQEAILACRRAEPDLAHALASAALLRVAEAGARRR